MMILYMALAFSLVSLRLWASSAWLAVMTDACHVIRLVLVADVLLSMLVREVLKSASFDVSMSLPCLASMSSRLVFASNVSPLILLMVSVYLKLWVRFWTGAVILSRRTSIVWILAQRLLLSLARSDILVSGFGLRCVCCLRLIRLRVLVPLVGTPRNAWWCACVWPVSRSVQGSLLALMFWCLEWLLDWHALGEDSVLGELVRLDGVVGSGLAWD